MIDFKKNLNFLISDEPFTIAMLDSWILEYKDDFIIASKSYNENGGIPHCYPTEEEIFYLAFINVLEICHRHTKEPYFKEQMVEYEQIKHSRDLLHVWAKRNEELGHDLLLFEIYSLDYADYDEDADLSLYIGDFEHDVYVKRSEFAATIKFVQTFNELYYNQNILPESMAKLEEEMKKAKSYEMTMEEGRKLREQGLLD